MKLILNFLILLATIGNIKAAQTNCTQIAECPNVGLFKIDALKESMVEDRLIREFRLSLVKQIKGIKPDFLAFTEKGQFGAMTPGPFAEPIINSHWFYPPISEGALVVVGYLGTIQNASFIEDGIKYGADFEFIASLPMRPDLTTVKVKMDQFLATHHGDIHSCVSTYIASYVAYSEWDDNVWGTYIKGNPLKLNGEAHAQLFAALANVLVGREFATETDRNVRASNTNKVAAELATQILGSEKGLPANTASVDVLRSLIRQAGFRMTESTLEKIDQLLKSEKLSDSQKKGFQRDKIRMRMRQNGVTGK